MVACQTCNRRATRATDVQPRQRGSLGLSGLDRSGLFRLIETVSAGTDPDGAVRTETRHEIDDGSGRLPIEGKTESCPP